MTPSASDVSSSALLYRGPWELELGARPLPSLRRDHVRVRVRATGICGTDIGIITGAYSATPGVTLGHESAGEVVAVGADVSTVSVGDRVVIDPTYSCAECRMCRSARPNHCASKQGTEAGVSAHGTFAELYDTESRFLHRLPDTLSYEEATLTEPLSCVLTGLDRLDLRAQQRIVVVGAGPIGMLACWALSARGMWGWLVERAVARRQLAMARAPRGWRIVDRLEAISEEATPLDVVVDTSGAALGDVLALLARGGQVLMMGLRKGTVIVDPAALADRSISLIGSIDSIGTFASALAMIASTAVPASSLISRVQPLAEYSDALRVLGCDVHLRERTDRAEALKVVLTP